MVNIIMAHDLAPDKIGRARSRTVVLIHGMWSRPCVWNNFHHALEERGYRVIAPALRHHDIEPDEAPNPALATTSLLDYAADLEREIRLLDEKPFIIGHSMGGTLAQMLAARDLAAGTVLLASAHCAPVIALNHAVLKYYFRELVTKPFWRHTQRPSWNTLRAAGLNGMNEVDARNLYATLIPESGRAAFELILWFLDSKRASLVDARHVNCPMLLLTGSEDMLTPPYIAQRIAAYYGDKAKLEILRGQAHWLPREAGWRDTLERALQFIEIEAPLLQIETGAINTAPVYKPQTA